MSTPTKSPNQKSDLVPFLVALVVMTVLGVGVGYALNAFFLAPQAALKQEVPAHGESAKASSGHGEGGAHGEGGGNGEEKEDLTIARFERLQPMIVSLSGEKEVWIRIECGALITGVPSKERPVLLAEITQDFTRFLKTLTLKSFEGPNAYLYLREDLNERARVRSGGKVSQIFITSLIVE